MAFASITDAYRTAERHNLLLRRGVQQAASFTFSLARLLRLTRHRGGYPLCVPSAAADILTGVASNDNLSILPLFLVALSLTFTKAVEGRGVAAQDALCGIQMEAAELVNLVLPGTHDLAAPLFRTDLASL
jgi:hypothetical protein